MLRDGKTPQTSLNKPKGNPYDDKFNWTGDTALFLENALEQSYVPLSEPKAPDGSSPNFGYYWFFKSENINAPTLVTCIGGPGFCVMSKALNRYNPYKLDIKEHKIVKNDPQKDISNRYNLLYLESPVGSGYSFCTKSTRVTSYDQIGNNAVEVIMHVVKQHPEMEKNGWWFNGESFCGYQIPVIAWACHEKAKLRIDGIILENPRLSYKQFAGLQDQYRALEEFKVWNGCCHKCYCNSYIRPYMNCCGFCGCLSFQQ